MMRKLSSRIPNASQILPWVIYLMGGELPQRELASRQRHHAIRYLPSRRRFRAFGR
jgi:hypothetical protein